MSVLIFLSAAIKQVFNALKDQPDMKVAGYDTHRMVLQPAWLA
jgi:hypothetical protein